MPPSDEKGDCVPEVIVVQYWRITEQINSILGLEISVIDSPVAREHKADWA
jgi:hypothetical protein